MIVTTPAEVEKVLQEAEQIKAGDNPATVTAEPEHAGDGPATGASEAAGTGTAPAPAPSASAEQLAELLCLLCDWPFVRAFGMAGQLAEPFRSEARIAWGEVLTTYLPSVISKAGPFGVLASLYCMHGAGLYVSCRMNAQPSESSAKEVPANQP